MASSLSDLTNIVELTRMVQIYILALKSLDKNGDDKDIQFERAGMEKIETRLRAEVAAVASRIPKEEKKEALDEIQFTIEKDFGHMKLGELFDTINDRLNALELDV